MVKKIIITALIIIVVFSVFYALTYHQWLNKKTVISSRQMDRTKSEIVLKNDEVASYFAKLKGRTKQDALINVKVVPSEKFDFFREFQNKLATYWAAVTYGKEILYLGDTTADEYFIDPFGLAIYRNFSSPEYYFTEQLGADPASKKLFKPIYQQGMSAEAGIRILFMSPYRIPSYDLSYPMIFNPDEEKVYININYLHSNEVFTGKYSYKQYNSFYNEAPEIIIGDDTGSKEAKRLVIGKDKAAVILPLERDPTKSGLYYPVLPYNKIISEYKLIDIDGLQYIDVSVITDLYGYEVNNHFSILNIISYYDSWNWGTDHFPGNFLSKFRMRTWYDYGTYNIESSGYEKRVGVTINSSKSEEK